MSEIWQAIVGFEDSYEVSDSGRVRNSKGALIKPWRNHNGYLNVSLYKKCARKTKRIHRLVLDAFVGPAPEGTEGAHKDGDKDNNTLANLAWPTPKQNALDRIRHGTQASLESHGSAKLNAAIVAEARAAHVKGCPINGGRALARKYGVDASTMRRVLVGHSWKDCDVAALSPPAPQPALALIEELEAALQAMMSERANGPDSYRIWGQAGTALASAKRFKGA